MMEISISIDKNKHVKRKSDRNNNVSLRYNNVGIEERQSVEDEQHNFVKVDEQYDLIKVEDDQYNFVKVEDVQYKIEDERYNVVNVEDDQSIVEDEEEEEEYNNMRVNYYRCNIVREEDDEFDIEYDQYNNIEIENESEDDDYNNTRVNKNNAVIQQMDSPSEIAVGNTFSSFFVFSNAFKNWCKKYYHPMRTQNSVKTHDGNTDFPYSYIVYTCIHCGKARRRSRNLRRNQKFLGCECPVKVSVSLIRKPALMYRISAVMSQHKNHPCGPEFFNLYPKLRLLHRYEQFTYKDFFNYDSKKGLKKRIWGDTGSCLGVYGIKGFKKKYKPIIDDDDDDDDDHGDVDIDS